jgi:hypothetical protein
MDVRFLLDEHIDHAIAAALRLRSYDVLTLAEANLLSADDFQRILPFALSDTRVIVTRDADFLVMHGRGDAHAGIVHWHGRKRNVKEAIHYPPSNGQEGDERKHDRRRAVHQATIPLTPCSLTIFRIRFQLVLSSAVRPLFSRQSSGRPFSHRIRSARLF